MISMAMLHDAQRVLKPVINRTPVIPTKGLVPGCAFYLKADCLQKTGAFKLRGAYYKIATLSDEEKKRGVIACSAGNHAQGVAFAARDMGIPATICIPEGAPLSKIEATRSYGANVVLVPGVYDDAYTEAVRLCKEQQLTFIHPFNDYRVMAGQGTIGLEILEQLPRIQQTLMTDIEATFDGDPAAADKEEIIFAYPGLFAIFVYRIAHELYLRQVPMIPRMMTEYAHSRTGIDIHPGAQIGRRLVIDHGAGIVIGETTQIGDDCLLYQGVTLGGTGKDVGKRHPTLGNNVMVGSGAKVLGPFRVGDNARIAANAVVLREVPPGATVVGVPGRIVRLCGDKLDHIHTPDPVMLEIEELKRRMALLEEQINDTKKET